MNRIAKLRAKKARYRIRNDKGRYLWRHWSGRWEWTPIAADARIFRSKGAAEKRAAEHEGAYLETLNP